MNSYLSSRPSDARRFLKGLILTEQNKPNEGSRSHRSLAGLSRAAGAHNNLAVRTHRRTMTSEELVEMAIRTHPSYATAHENLGDIYAKMASQARQGAAVDRSNQPRRQLNSSRPLSQMSTVSASPARPTKVVTAKVEPTPAPFPSRPPRRSPTGTSAAARTGSEGRTCTKPAPLTVAAVYRLPPWHRPRAEGRSTGSGESRPAAARVRGQLDEVPVPCRRGRRHGPRTTSLGIGFTPDFQTPKGCHVGVEGAQGAHREAAQDRSRCGSPG